MCAANSSGIKREYFTEEQQDAYAQKLQEALDAGYAVLENGGISLDAIQVAINIMEDSPLFNAGKGAVYNSDGNQEMDAAIMDGKTLNAGAIAGVNHIKNPILHDDIDKNETYLSKTEESLQSILILYSMNKVNSNFVSILKLYVFLKKTKLIYFVKFGFKILENKLRKQILSKNPSLGVFNVYRIGYLCSLKE